MSCPIWTQNFVLLQVADIIKEDLWANPLTYFNNVSYSPFFLILTLVRVYKLLEGFGKSLYATF